MPDDRTSAEATTIRAGTPVPLAGRHIALVVFFREGVTVRPLPETGALVVGRGEPADLKLEDPSLSRQHARFVCEGDEVWVEDLGSTNGTRINGRRSRRGRVKVGDAVGLGSVAVSLHALSAVETELHGVESYERLAAALEEEVVRAQTFGRAVGVLLLQAAGRTAARLDRWCPNVRALLRPVDRLALYSPGVLLVCLVESDLQRTAKVAEQVVLAHKGERPAMLCGWSVYPDCAASAEALIATVGAAARQATRRAPVVGAPPVALGGSAPPLESARVVRSPRMEEVFRLAEHLAASQIPVLIQGETGVGKELVAQAIHTGGPRARHPLRSVN